MGSFPSVSIGESRRFGHKQRNRDSSNGDSKSNMVVVRVTRHLQLSSSVIATRVQPVTLWTREGDMVRDTDQYTLRDIYDITGDAVVM